ncbi:hypothetical protein PZA11_002407 [Diplocarpon coronariae]
MDKNTALEGPAIAPAASTTLGETAPAPTQPQGFEWIPHGDSTARKRARAHVTRGFRRQKAAEALLSGGKQTSKTTKRASNIGSQESTTTSLVDVATPHPREETKVDMISGQISTRGSPIVLPRSMSHTFPFAEFPVKLSPEKQRLLYHFIFGLVPLSFAGHGRHNRGNYQPVKMIVFKTSLVGEPGFHVLLSAAANDIASMRGLQNSKDGIQHHAIAIRLVNQRISDWKSDFSSECLSSVALLAGLELLFGTPEALNVHMNGLAIMLDLEGGLESIRHTEPQVHAMISCELPHTDPDGVPADILSNLSGSYDLYGELMSVLSGMSLMTTVSRSDSASDAQRHEVSNNVARIDTALHQWIRLPRIEGCKSRRRYVLQSLYLVALIYTSLVSEYNVPQNGIFLERFERIWAGDAHEWGMSVGGVFRSLLQGDHFGSQEFESHAARLVDSSITRGWIEWRDINETLLKFFMYDQACRGQLQTLWKGRLEQIPPVLAIGQQI